MIDFDNEQSVLCRIVSNTTTEDNEHVMTDEIDKMVFNESDHISDNNYPMDLRIASKKVLYIQILSYNNYRFLYRN